MSLRVTLLSVSGHLTRYVLLLEGGVSGERSGLSKVVLSPFGDLSGALLSPAHAVLQS